MDAARPETLPRPDDPASVESLAPDPSPDEARVRGTGWFHRIESPFGVGLLEAVSLTYVGLPILIFVVGWLRLPIAVVLLPAIALLLARSRQAAVAWARENYAPGALPDAYRSPWALAWRAPVLVALAAFMVACTGAGGFTFQFSDYWVYDGHLRELMTYPWPPGAFATAEVPPDRVPGSYYWGYFLPAAAVGRLFGWEPAYVFQCFWNTLGVLLSVIWFLRIIGTFRLRYALLFLFFGGLDLIGYLVTAPLPGTDGITWTDYLTGTFSWSIGPGWMAHWSSNFALLTEGGQEIMGGVFYRFYGPMSFLSDGPQHVLPIWVILLMVLHDALRRRTVERLFFLTSFLPLCSVFAPIGTLPLLFLAVIRARGRGLLTLGNLVAGPILVAGFVLYYSAVDSDLPQGFLWEFQQVGQTWPYLLLYYVSAFLIYVLAAPSMQGNGYRPGRLWFYTAVVVFLLAPWYRMGVYNDFTTKVIVPCQLVFLVCLATALREPAGKHALRRRALLVAAIVIGAWSAVGIIHRAVTFGFSWSVPPMERVAFTVDTFQQTADSKMTFDRENFFWKHLAKPVDYFQAPKNYIVQEFDFADPEMDPEHWIYYTDERRYFDDGLMITTKANEPLLRRNDVDLDTREIGSVVLEHSVVDEEGDTPEYSIVFQWAREEDIEEQGTWWPFHEWRSWLLHPRPDALKPVAANAYWRGEVEDFALYFEVKDADPDKKYTVTLHRLVFLRR